MQCENCIYSENSSCNNKSILNIDETCDSFCNANIYIEIYNKAKTDTLKELYETILIDTKNGQEDLRQALFLIEQMQEENNE